MNETKRPDVLNDIEAKLCELGFIKGTGSDGSGWLLSIAPESSTQIMYLTVSFEDAKIYKRICDDSGNIVAKVSYDISPSVLKDVAVFVLFLNNVRNMPEEGD